MFKRKSKESEKMHVVYARDMMNIFGVIDSNEGKISFGFRDERKLERGKRGTRIKIGNRVYRIEDYLCIDYNTFIECIQSGRLDIANYDEFKRLVYKRIDEIKLVSNNLVNSYTLSMGDNYIGSDYILLKKDGKRGVTTNLHDIYSDICNGTLGLV